jgi:hypothetical protein
MAQINDPATILVANVPTTDLGRFFPKRPIVADPKSGSEINVSNKISAAILVF